jgi:uncharacterized ubiquitin-like protein YukD
LTASDPERVKKLQSLDKILFLCKILPANLNRSVMTMSSAEKLKELIDKAIEDQELSVSEHEKILTLADKDRLIDQNERALLHSLQCMIENGTIKKVPDKK